MLWYKKLKYRLQASRVNSLREKATLFRTAAVRCETKANSECRKLHKMQAATLK